MPTGPTPPTQPTSSNSPIAWPTLRERIEGGASKAVVKLLAPCPPNELKHLQTDVKALYSELRKREYNQVHGQWGPLLAAGLLTAQTPAQAVFWLSKSILVHEFWKRRTGGVWSDPDNAGFPTLLTRWRDPAWSAEVCRRMADAMRTEPDSALWEITYRLAADVKAEVPLTDGYVTGWVQAGRTLRYRDSRGGEHNTLRSWLASETGVRALVARAFEIPGLGSRFVDAYYARFGEANEWPKVLVKLAGEGVLDRGELLDSCTSALLRGDRPGSLRGYVAVYEELSPTAAEVGERLATYLGILASGPGAAAKPAQRDLRAMDAVTPLDVRTLADACTDVFSRTETGLAGSQLGWIDAAIKRDPAAVSLLLPTIATAFTHPAFPVQQRALKLVGKHARKADREVLEQIRGAIQDIDPVLRADAEQALAAQSGSAAETEAAARETTAIPRLPEYQPTPMPDPPATIGELVTALAAPLAGVHVDAIEVERILAGTAVLAHRDRAALEAALTPLWDRYGDVTTNRWGLLDGGIYPKAVASLCEALLGRYRGFEHGRLGWATVSMPIEDAAHARLHELARLFDAGGTVPVLLATPTGAEGGLDPSVLLERLAAYRACGATPMRRDLQQALLRLPPDPGPEPAAALAELPPLPGPVPDLDDYLSQVTDDETANLMPLARPLILPRSGPPLPPPGTEDELFDPFWIVSPPWNPNDRDVFGRVGSPETNHWPITLPHHPELLAAHAIPVLYNQANGADSADARTLFPQFADTLGRPGPLAHLALAYGLAADQMTNRVAAQDAMLTLAARDLLRPEHLGLLAAQLWKRDMIRWRRLINSLREVEQAGAPAQVFATAVAMLRTLAATPGVSGLPDLLLLASRCATTAGIRGAEIPGLADLAEAKKPARVGQEARRLREVLAAAG